MKKCKDINLKIISKDIRFDIIRIFCIMWVVFYCHMSEYTFNNYYKYNINMDITHACMACMALISGYFMGSNNKCINKIKELPHFYIRRLKRIYPLYFLAAVLMYWLDINIGGDLLLSTLLLVGAISGKEPRTLWFVCALTLMYLITPLINNNWLKKNFKLKIMVSIIISLFFILEAIGNYKVDGRLVYFAPSYVLGMLLSDFDIKRLLKPYFSIVMVAFLFICTYWVDKVGIDNSLFIRALIMNIPIMYLMFSISFYLGEIILADKVISIFSYMSFPAYLFHRIIFIMLIRIMGVSKMPVIIAYLVATPIVFVVSFLIQYIYDCLIKVKI